MTEMMGILRSPSGLPLSLQEGSLQDESGQRFRFEDNVASLYDEADVSPFLSNDLPKFQASFSQPGLREADDISGRQQVYERARAINTDFMFSVLKFKNPGQRRVAEIGVGACDLIRRFAKDGFQTVAVDFFPWQMQIAHRDAMIRGDADFACVSATMAKLPFADASLDMVYFHAALHHALPRDHAEFRWFDPRNLLDCLKEVRRVLKPREQGGAFLLLGEGIYPEDFGLKDRIYEQECIANPELVYEAWYKISEYEAMYKEAGLYPNIFLWQENFMAEAIGYSAKGERFDLVTKSDLITDTNYWRLAAKLQPLASQFLPDWITVRDASENTNPFADIFSADEIIATSMHTECGVPAISGRTPIFQSSGATGFLMFGPYVALDPGRYEAIFVVRGSGVLSFDSLSPEGALGRPVSLSLRNQCEWQRVVMPLEVAAGAKMIETRAMLLSVGDQAVEIAAAVAIRRVD